MLASDLRLRKDQLQRVGVRGVGDGVVENADGLQQVTSDPRLAREVRRVGKNLLCLGLDLRAPSGEFERFERFRSMFLFGGYGADDADIGVATEGILE